MATKRTPARKRTTKKAVAKKVVAKKAAAKAKAPAPKAKAAKARPRMAKARVTATKPAARPAGQTAAETRAERRRRFPEALRLRDFSASLTVNDLERSIAHYVDGLGFTVKERWEKDGKLMGVMLVAGGCEIGLSQDDWGKGRDRAKGVGVSFYAETGQSLDLIAALARERGIAVEGPKVASWGNRMLEIKDPDGFKLTIYWPK